MSEKFANTPVLDPTISEPSVSRRNQVVKVGALKYDVYDISQLGLESRVDHVLVNNSDGFNRLLTSGLDAVQEGETVSWCAMEGDPLVSAVQPRFTSVGMQGGAITLDHDVVPDNNPGVEQVYEPNEEAQEVPELSAPQANIAALLKDTELVYIDPSLDGLTDRQDALGDTVRVLGFSGTEHVSISGSNTFRRKRFSSPTSLVRNIAAARQRGLAIPEVRFFQAGHIDDDSYVQSWQDGKFPASIFLEYYGHDIVSEHFYPQVVFNGIPTRMAQLYAQAGREADTIVARRPENQYAFNDPNYWKVEVTSTSEAHKLSLMSDALDRLSTGFSVFNSDLDTSPKDVEDMSESEEYNHVISEVAEVILGSAHRQEFLDLLQAMNSTAVDEQGEFSLNTFQRDLISWAQDFWNITPKAKVVYETLGDHSF